MKKTLSSLLVLLIASTWLTSAGAEQTINNCPVPDNMKIVAPDKDKVPQKLALLSGIWEGIWASSVVFVVEQITADEAVVVFAWAGAMKSSQAGTASPPRICQTEMPGQAGRGRELSTYL